MSIILIAIIVFNALTSIITVQFYGDVLSDFVATMKYHNTPLVLFINVIFVGLIGRPSVYTTDSVVSSIYCNLNT